MTTAQLLGSTSPLALLKGYEAYTRVDTETWQSYAQRRGRRAASGSAYPGLLIVDEASDIPARIWGGTFFREQGLTFEKFDEAARLMQEHKL